MDRLKPGQSAVIQAVGGSGSLRHHLLDMGLTPQTEVTLQKTAPMGDPVQIKAADVSDNEAVRQMIDDVFGKEGRIDFLFNNAGIGQAGPTERASIRAWERVINTNLWGVIYATHAVLPIMLAQRCGHIVNTASIGGRVNHSGYH